MGNVASSQDYEEDTYSDAKERELSQCNETESDSPLDLSVLFNATALRNIATKILTELPVNLIQIHSDALTRWLNENLQQNVEFISQSQFLDFLSNRSVSRESCRQVKSDYDGPVFQYFDTEGEGIADIKLMKEIISKSEGGSIFSDIDPVIKRLQACSFTPGFTDIYNDEKFDVGQHALRLLKFLIRNRSSSSLLPYPKLTCFNNTVQMRLNALTGRISQIRTKVSSKQEIQQNEFASFDYVPVVNCVLSHEVSSNPGESQKMFDVDGGASYWQSDGSARSHWVRLRIKNGINIKQLRMVVMEADQSYMPQHIGIFAGYSLSSLLEIKEVKIPQQTSGEIVLLDHIKTFYPIIQINIKRCQNEGCDCRIRGLRVVGYRKVNEAGISPTDAMTSWFLQVLSETTSACLPTSPHLRTNIIRHTSTAFRYMPPLSLSPASTEKPSYLSPHVLQEMESFLKTMAVCPDGKMVADDLSVMLAFYLAQGDVVGVLKTLKTIQDLKIKNIEFRTTMHSLTSVLKSFWKNNGHYISMSLAGCDGGQKDDSSGPSNVLSNSWASTQPYISKDGQTKVNMFFKSSSRILFTKVRIKNSKGSKGMRHGMVFVYDHDGEFVLEEHVYRFKDYDGWRQIEYCFCKTVRDTGCLKKTDNPVAYFSFDGDWDEMDIHFDAFQVGQYVLVKFFETPAENLSIVGLRFYGFRRKSTSVADCFIMDLSYVNPGQSDEIDSKIVTERVLGFLVCLSKDETTVRNDRLKPKILNTNCVSVNLLWDFYQSFQECYPTANLLLRLFHTLFPILLQNRDNINPEATEALFNHLCDIVDSKILVPDHLLTPTAKEVITDGAALFFPDKEARVKHLFQLIKDINAISEKPSVALTFQSLCQFFSSVDPGALLDLPTSPTLDCDFAPVLSVMDTMISVAHRECQSLMETVKQSEKSSHLVHLLCSLQTSLLVWCSSKIDPETGSDQTYSKESADSVQLLLSKYVTSFSNKIVDSLEQFSKCAEKEQLVDLLKESYLATTLPQLILFLSHLCDKLICLSKTSFLLLFQMIVRQLAIIALQLPDIFHQVDSNYWKLLDTNEEMLKSWEVESSHNYENNLKISQNFTFPGATSFKVEFDPRCETERRYDYLEFTDSRGTKKRFEHKVNTDRWPLVVTFKSDSQLNFHFHSDSSNNEWGYKFKVTAKGVAEIPICWLFDLQLNLVKLLGKFCGSTLDSSSLVDSEESDESENELLKSNLWMTIFKSGFNESTEVSDAKALTPTETFILSLVEEKTEQTTTFLNNVKEHQPATLNIADDSIDELVISVFAALLWHTQALRDDVEKFVQGESNIKLSDGIYQAYNMAECLRLYLVEQRQLSKSSDDSPAVFDLIPLMKDKARFLLKFAGLAKIQLKLDAKQKVDRHHKSKAYNRFIVCFGGEKGSKTDTVFEKYPSFRLVLEFVRDSAWSKERVEKLLVHRSATAQSITEVYKFLNRFLQMTAEYNGDIFQIQTVVMFQELLQYQDKFALHYADNLDGCGLELEANVRDAFYALLRNLIASMKSTKRKNLPADQLQCYDYIMACMLHLLSVNWQLCDLALLEELRMPQIYYDLIIASVPVREKSLLHVDEKEEFEVYKRYIGWLEECKKSGFSPWYEKYHKEEKRDLQTFIARFSDILEVEIACDGCGMTVPGARYHCLQCVDMDLCSSCYAGGIDPGGEHLPSHELIHFMFKCDGCQGFITGPRIHCNVCEDFDLCLSCQNTKRYPSRHKPEHSFQMFMMIKLNLIESSCSVIQSYIHQYVWLLYSSLTLSVANVLYSKHQEHVECDFIKSATQLYNHCIEKASDFMSTLQLSQSNLSGSDFSESEVLKDDIRTQEETFAIHLQERIMGLLGAMIPELNKTILAEDISQSFVSKEFVHMLFSIASGIAKCDSNTQHFALGLISQLLQHVPSTSKTTDVWLWDKTGSEDSDEPNDVDSLQPDGYKTVQFLFHFGAACLEKSSIDFASTVVTTLVKLCPSPAWRDVLQSHITKRIEKLKQGKSYSLSSIFALYVIAGFPEVLTSGSLVTYTESQTEVRHGIVVKHFIDKFQTMIVDRKSRRRRILKDVLLDVVNYDNCLKTELNITSFIDITKDLVAKVKSGEVDLVEMMWVLALVLKTLLKAIRQNQKSDALYESAFIQSVLYLACIGTGFSKQWRLTDLEILSLTLYTKDEASHDCIRIAHKPEMPAFTRPLKNPLDGLSDLAQQTFHTLHEGLNVPLSVLRALYESLGHNTDSLLISIHENVRSGTYHPSDEILLMSKKWEKPTIASVSSLPELEEDKIIDAGLQMLDSTSIQPITMDFVGSAEVESTNEPQQLIQSIDSDLGVNTDKQRRTISAMLLKNEISADRTNLFEFLIKVNQALTILYSRLVLTTLLADWPITGHEITADLIGCEVAENLPFVLDLLNRPDSGDVFEKMVRNVIEHCRPENLLAINKIACSFMKEVSLTTTTKESSHFKNLSDSELIEEKIYIPGATYLTVRFDPKCSTEEGGNELVMASSVDYQQDRRVFSGPSDEWCGFEMPGDMLYYSFRPESNCDYGFRFTVNGGRLGRFDTGYIILHELLSSEETVRILPFDELWRNLIYVTCKQTGLPRLKSLRLLLMLLKTQFKTKSKKLSLDFGLLRPLWRLYRNMLVLFPDNGEILPPLMRALCELFLISESLALDWALDEEYVLSLYDEEDVFGFMLPGLQNVAHVSTAINYQNKATEALRMNSITDIDLAGISNEAVLAFAAKLYQAAQNPSETKPVNK